MVLIDDLDLRAAQEDAEGDMIDTCVITGPATSPVFDEGTGVITSTPGAVIYTGRCKRPPPTSRFQQIAQSGGHAFVEERDQLSLPISAPRIPAGSIAMITAAPRNPHSVGQKLRVTGPGTGSSTTAQRLNVTEVVG